MSETFFVNIDCSKILGDSHEAKYTMFIDRTKMTIVFELIEWIRWVFSVENCVYLTHENSVIHELEEITFLSKLKNFEIKPCGRFQCVHTKTYRTLLKNLNFFVSWNENKVPKYFLDKINQMTNKFSLEIKNPGKTTQTKDFMENEKAENIINKAGSSENPFLKQNVPKLSLEDSPLNKKRAPFIDFETKSASSNEIRQQMSDFSDSKKALYPYKCTDYDKFCVDQPVKPGSNIRVSPTVNNNALKNDTDVIKNVMCKVENKCNKFRPFSIGEMVSNLRETLEKEKMEANFSQKHSSFCEEDENMKVADFFSKDGEIISQKRKRTRKRKKSKKKNLEDITFESPLLEAAPNFQPLNSISNVKPNHIRFETNDENNDTEIVNFTEMTEAACKLVMGNLKKQTSKTGTENFHTLTNFNSNGLDSSLITSSAINENEMECSEVLNKSNNEEKLIDLDDPDCNGTGNFQKNSFVQDSSVLDSLKDKFKTSVVVERFY